MASPPLPPNAAPLVTLGVISDTHVPDRARRLHPRVMPLFQEAGVTAILHAGDISTPAVLAELGRVAPVTAVLGNRDWLLRGSLPMQARLEFAGVQVVLAHGHGGWSRYLFDKFQYLLRGYRAERYQRPLLKAYPGARVIVYGHTHRPANLWVAGRLLFNPGAAGVISLPGWKSPTVGLLRIFPGGEVAGEIVRLDGEG